MPLVLVGDKQQMDQLIATDEGTVNLFAGMKCIDELERAKIIEGQEE